MQLPLTSEPGRLSQFKTLSTRWYRTVTQAKQSVRHRWIMILPQLLGHRLTLLFFFSQGGQYSVSPPVWLRFQSSYRRQRGGGSQRHSRVRHRSVRYEVLRVPTHGPRLHRWRCRVPGSGSCCWHFAIPRSGWHSNVYILFDYDTPG